MYWRFKKWATREAERKINKAEKWKGMETVWERQGWSQNMWSCKVIYYFSTFISTREGPVIRMTELKDIQACSRKSVKGTLMTATNSLSIPGLAYRSAQKAFPCNAHTPVLAYICTSWDSSVCIKIQKQLHASHNSAEEVPTWQRDFDYFN